jgi:hypothetical protein
VKNITRTKSGILLMVAIITGAGTEGTRENRKTRIKKHRKRMIKID